MNGYELPIYTELSSNRSTKSEVNKKTKTQRTQVLVIFTVRGLTYKVETIPIGKMRSDQSSLQNV